MTTNEYDFKEDNTITARNVSEKGNLIRSLVEKYYEPILGMASRISERFKIRSLSEDIANESVVRILKSEEDYSRINEARFLGYAHKTIYNIAIGIYRKRKTESRLKYAKGDSSIIIDRGSDVVFESVICNHKPEYIGIESREEIEKIRKVINNEVFFIPYKMFHLEGSTYAEITDKLGIPAGTVMSRISRAKKRMQENKEKLEEMLEAA